MTFTTDLQYICIVIQLQVAHYQLMKYNAVRAFVQKREYLIWPEDPQDLDWFYERLVSQILKDTKVKKFAEDKAEPEQPDVQPQQEDGVQEEDEDGVHNEDGVQDEDEDSVHNEDGIELKNIRAIAM